MATQWMRWDNFLVLELTLFPVRSFSTSTKFLTQLKTFFQIIPDTTIELPTATSQGNMNRSSVKNRNLLQINANLRCISIVGLKWRALSTESNCNINIRCHQKPWNNDWFSSTMLSCDSLRSDCLVDLRFSPKWFNLAMNKIFKISFCEQLQANTRFACDI